MYQKYQGKKDPYKLYRIGSNIPECSHEPKVRINDWICDTLSQLPNSAILIPINAITSILGAPIVIWLLIRKRKMMN